MPTDLLLDLDIKRPTAAGSGAAYQDSRSLSVDESASYGGSDAWGSAGGALTDVSGGDLGLSSGSNSGGAMAWVKKNPLYAGLGFAAIGGALFLALRKGQGKRK